MKRHSSQLGVWLSAAAILIAGCNKKPQPTVAPQAQAPTVTAPETTTPAPAAQPPVTEPTETTSIPVNQPPAEPTTTTTQPKPKPRPKSNHAGKNGTAQTTTTGKDTNGAGSPASGQTPATTASNTPGRTVVRDGGNSNTPGDILPGMDRNQAAQQRQAIDQLLQSTDAALKAITRTLSNEERATVDQIRAYMAQSRTAETDGDLLRANNLATKAHLLSDSLVKR